MLIVSPNVHSRHLGDSLREMIAATFNITSPLTAGVGELTCDGGQVHPIRRRSLSKSFERLDNHNSPKPPLNSRPSFLKLQPKLQPEGHIRLHLAAFLGTSEHVSKARLTRENTVFSAFRVLSRPDLGNHRSIQLSYGSRVAKYRRWLLSFADRCFGS